MTKSPTSSASGAAFAGKDAIEQATAAMRPLAWLRDARLLEAAVLLERNEASAAANIAREFLGSRPDDAHAIQLFAEASARLGQLAEAEQLFARCVSLSPAFAAARFGYANLLLGSGKIVEASHQAGILLEQDARNPLFRRLKALVLEGSEDFRRSSEVWRGLIDEFPSRPDCWLRYGHALRAMSRREECIAAYRRSTALAPAFGAAWWALADMKTCRFEETEIAEMERQIAQPHLAPGDRAQILFALGKAFGDAQQYDRSFAIYAEANAINRHSHPHNRDALTAYVARCKTLFSASFFSAREGTGCDSEGPVFLVGMTRAGSTLVEQILASHPEIEATRELANLSALPFAIQHEFLPKFRLYYPEILQQLDAATLQRLGEHYLEGVRPHRKKGRRFFVDKMGANFLHAGLIRLLIPRARIIDVRRHPLACGFSMFTQLFPQGQNESYDLADIGRYYRDYVDLMAHFDRVQPAGIHRIHYEQLIENPEAEIRRLLDHVGVAFDPACLEFHKTNRVLTTASSEQVRNPLYREALDAWRPYESWLDPLKASLGSVLDAYPDVPAEFRQAPSGTAPM